MTHPPHAVEEEPAKAEPDERSPELPAEDREAATTSEAEFDGAQQGKRGGFGRGFWFSILTLALIVGVAQWRISHLLTAELEEVTEEVVEAPKASPEVRIKRGLLALIFQRGAAQFEQTRSTLHAEISAEFEQIRGESDRLIVGWADWYYSVTGEYGRLLSLLTAAAGEESLEAAKGAASAYMAEQVKSRLIEPIGADARIADLEERLTQQLGAHHRQLMTALKSELVDLQGEAERQGRLHVDDLQLLDQEGQRLIQLDQINIVSPVAIATKALGIGGLTRQLAARGTTKVGQVVAMKVAGKGLVKGAVSLWMKLLVKFGIKTAAKGGGALAAAGAGTVSCSFLGLGAVACGLVAGAATWFAVDKLVVEVDEYMNRAEFEAELKADLRGSWSEVEGMLHRALDQHFEQVKTTLVAPTTPSVAPRQTTTLIETLQRK